MDLEPAAAVDPDAVALDQLLLDEVEEVWLAPFGVASTALEVEPLRGGGVGLRAGDELALDHLVEDLVAALERGRRVAEGVELRRRLRKAREQRGLVQVELTRVLRVEGLGGCLDPDRGAPGDRAVGNGVEVLLENPLLRVALLELGCELRLLDLALEVPLRVLDVERADELLGDRRATLDRLARLDVAHGRADDRAVIHALVLVEAAVLDRDRRVAHLLGHVLPRQHGADLVRLDVAEARAVRSEDLRAAALVDRLEVVDVDARGNADDVADETEHGEPDDAADESNRQKEAVARASSLASLLSLPVAHREVFWCRCPDMRAPRRGGSLQGLGKRIKTRP